MIRYSLSCRNAHQFEAWFAGSDVFEKQRAASQITCPDCGTSEVSKMLMTPSVSTSKSKQQETEPVPVASSTAVPDEVLAMMRQIRDKVTESADYVGRDFAEEARKIHYGEQDERGIYGEASADEVMTLHEEGIDILPLPVLPEDRN